jgi:hypothetical protein
MAREISAGGAVVTRMRGRWFCAVIEPDMRVEVAAAEWIPLEQARGTLSYRGEREMATRALGVQRWI